MADRVRDGARRWWQAWRRRVAISALVAGLTIAIGAVLGTLLVSGSPSPTRNGTIARLAPITPGSLVLDPAASPEELDEPRGMGSLHAGVALLALSEVDEVRTEDGRRRPPEGSRLLAFEVGDWTCEVRPCESWRSLKPSVVVDGTAEDLPEGGDTFVIALPPGTREVELAVDADGYEQSLSLVDDTSGSGNIVLLAEEGAERKVVLRKTFRLGERTSIVLDDGAGGGTDVFEREVGVDYAQLRFFLHGATPSTPGRAFLVVNAYYTYAGREGRFILAPGEVVFTDDDGKRYAGRDLDPAPEKGLLGFEVPASLRSGTFVVGGSVDKVSSTGVPYVSTLQEHRLPLTVG